jgi:flagellar protein FliO/FliZ
LGGEKLKKTQGKTVYFSQMRLFQNFSFWNSYLRFTWKSGHLTAFPRGCFKTNRVLEQPQVVTRRGFFRLFMLVLVLASVYTPVLSAQELGTEAPVTEDAIILGEEAIILGEDTPGVPAVVPGTSAGLILRMLLILALAAAAVYGVVYFIKRASRPAERRDPNVKLLSSVHLGSNRFVHALAVGTKVWLLGAGDSGVNLIAEIEDPDTVNAMLLEESRRSAEAAPGGFLDFKAMLRRFGIPVDKQVPGADNIRKRRDRIRGFK